MRRCSGESDAELPLQLAVTAQATASTTVVIPETKVLIENKNPPDQLRHIPYRFVVDEEIKVVRGVKEKQEEL